MLELSRRLFTVQDYHRMVGAGILREDDRVELIRGEIVAMSPIGPPHNGVVLKANNLIMPLVAGRAIVSAQGAIRLDEFNELQPDIVLLRPRADFYTTAHAAAADIVLIIEIADSSLAYDLQVKAGLYAEAGIAEYWVSDLQHDCVWVHSQIRDNAYFQIVQFHRDETLKPQLLPDSGISVETLLA